MWLWSRTANVSGHAQWWGDEISSLWDFYADTSIDSLVTVSLAHSGTASYRGAQGRGSSRKALPRSKALLLYNQQIRNARAAIGKSALLQLPLPSCISLENVSFHLSCAPNLSYQRTMRQHVKIRGHSIFNGSFQQIPLPIAWQLPYNTFKK